jgi:hypothetical protein
LLFRFPLGVVGWKTNSAGPITGSPRVILVEKEHAVTDVTAMGDCPSCSRAIETAIDAGAAMAAERPRSVAHTHLAAGSNKCPGSGHRLSAFFSINARSLTIAGRQGIPNLAIGFARILRRVAEALATKVVQGGDSVSV